MDQSNNNGFQGNNGYPQGFPGPTVNGQPTPPYQPYPQQGNAFQPNGQAKPPYQPVTPPAGAPRPAYQPNAPVPPYQPNGQAPNQTFRPFQPNAPAQEAPAAAPAKPAFEAAKPVVEQAKPAFEPAKPAAVPEIPVIKQEAPAAPANAPKAAAYRPYPQQPAAAPGTPGAAYQQPYPPQENGYQPYPQNAPADEEAAPKQKKKKTGLIVGLIAAVVAIGAGLAVLFLVIMPQQKYNKAKDLLDAGDYDAAYEAFEALGDYKDSADMLDETRYQQAKGYLKAKQFDKAYDAFKKLGGYADSKNMLNEVRYQQAKNLLENGEYERAYDILGALGDYADCQELLTEVRYQNAVDMLDTGEYDSAYVLFKGLEGYSDADEKLDEIVANWTDDVLEYGVGYESYAGTVELDDDQVAAVYDKVTAFIDEHSDDEMEDWRLEHAWKVLAVADALPDSYEQTEHIRSILTWLDGYDDESTFYSENADAVEALFETDWIRGLMRDEYTFIGFLVGEWSTYNDQYHFSITENDNGSYTASYDLPWVEKPDGAMYFGIKDYYYYHEDENHEPLAEVFRFTPKGVDTIVVYCYKDGSTFTMSRR